MVTTESAEYTFERGLVGTYALHEEAARERGYGIRPCGRASSLTTALELNISRIARIGDISYASETTHGRIMTLATGAYL